MRNESGGETEIDERREKPTERIPVINYIAVHGGWCPMMVCKNDDDDGDARRCPNF